MLAGQGVYRRKLVEVSLPLGAINEAAARERATPVIPGHPRGLHLWWSRKPLTACRALLFASLVDDPSAVSEEFPDSEAQETERQRLFTVIEALVARPAQVEPAVLLAARREIARSVARAKGLEVPEDQVLLSFLRRHAPVVHDPFCGGGSIPLEAARLGLRTAASDLNPVAILISKALLEYPSRFAEIARDIREYGGWMLDEARRRLRELYSNSAGRMASVEGDGHVVAWRWARTVRCSNPACNATVPLVWSFSLATGKGWIQPHPEPSRGRVRFSVHMGPGTAPSGTSSRRGAHCLCCGSVTPISKVREAGRRGQLGHQLMAVVVKGPKGHRQFLAPDDEQERLAHSVVAKWRPEADLVPNSRHVTPVVYGMTRHSDLYTERQLVHLGTLATLVKEAHARMSSGDEVQRRRADAVATYLALAVSRIADYNSTLCTWDGKSGKVRNTFARQAFPMTWDFVEVNPLADSTGSFASGVETVAKIVELLPGDMTEGSVFQHDAAEPREEQDGSLICTDPPYYDNVPYGDLSDYFYVWLRHALQEIHPELCTTLLVPKDSEIVVDPLRHGGKSRTRTLFESRMRQVVKNLRSLGDHQYPLTSYYASKHVESKESEGQAGATGWEFMLKSLHEGGFQQGGTWPLRTELTNRMRSLNSNALASSIVLVCRPRPADAPTIDRRAFLTALRAELPTALTELQQSNIAPIDLAQAAIGPGMAVYTRQARVVDADGNLVSVREALSLINGLLDEAMAEPWGDFDPASRWALAWFEQSGFNEGDFGTAEMLSKAKNTSLEQMESSGILRARAGKVRLLKPEELPGAWRPEAQAAAWVAVHHLIRSLESSGESATAELVSQLGPKAELARELCYRLFSLCERRKDASQARSYNNLVQSWPEVARLAREGQSH